MERKTAVKRAFQGLAGSSFARVSEPAITIIGPVTESIEDLTASIIKKAGRPRKHADAAARQRACRARKALKAEAKSKENEWRRVIRENYDSKGRLPEEFSGDNGVGKMSLIAEAARRNKSIEVPEDYDENEISSVIRRAALTGRSGGRRVAPKGWSSKKNEDIHPKQRKIETDATFINDQHFPLDWGLDAADKREIVHELTQRIFIAEIRSDDTVFAPDVEDVGIERVLRCQICDINVNVMLQAIEHTEMYHHRLCQDEFKRLTPRSAGKCTVEYHALLKARNGRFCKRCHTDFKDLEGNIVTVMVEV